MEKISIEEIRKLALVEMIQEVVKDQASPAIVLPNDCALHSLEKFQANPNRVTGKVWFGNIVSLIGYINEHKVDESRIFWNRNAPEIPGMVDQGLATVECHLNYHGNNTVKEEKLRPSWDTHRAAIKLIFCDEFVVYERACRKIMRHREFLEFLEDYGHFIDKIGEGQNILDVVRDLKASKTVKFGGKRDLDTGDVELSFSKKTSAQRDDMVMPTRIRALLPILKGGNFIDATFRLIYDVMDDGELLINMSLIRREVLLRKALDDALEQIKVGTETVIYETEHSNG